MNAMPTHGHHDAGKDMGFGLGQRYFTIMRSVFDSPVQQLGCWLPIAHTCYVALGQPEDEHHV